MYIFARDPVFFIADLLCEVLKHKAATGRLWTV